MIMKKIVFGILSILLWNGVIAQSKIDLGKSIDSIMAKYNVANEPGASVLVIQKNKTIFKKGYGIRNIETGEPIGTNTNFRLASVTKQFTAMCILLLEKRGKLSLNDSLIKYFTSFPEYGNGIRIKDLLTHSSGLLDYEDLMPSNQTVQLHDTNCMQLMYMTDSLYFPAGTNYKYSNTGYSILSLIVEQVSGQPFAQFLQQNIFKKLGMKTSVAFEEGKSTVANRAYGHSKINGAWVQTDQSLTSAVLGDGGIYTNVEEYSKWIKSLWSNRFIGSAMQQRAWSKTKLDNGNIINYGYGWHVEDFMGITHPYHDGSSIGFRNSAALFPDKKLMIVVLTNRNEHDPIEEVHKIASLLLK
jgi:CubicO group peptidase (beta-lactamase class C family)